MFLSHIQFLQGSVRVIRDACKKGGQRITKSGGVPLLKASNSIDNPTVDLSTSGFQIMCCQYGQEPFTHLIIGEIEQISSHTSIIFFNSEISALINHG